MMRNVSPEYQLQSKVYSLLRQWKKWVSLSNRVTEDSLLRLQPKTGTVCAVTQVSLYLLLSCLGEPSLAIVSEPVLTGLQIMHFGLGTKDSQIFFGSQSV